MRAHRIFVRKGHDLKEVKPNVAIPDTEGFFTPSLTLRKDPSGCEKDSVIPRKGFNHDAFKLLQTLANDLITLPNRAGEMIPEVGGLGLGGPRRKGSPSVSKGPKSPIQLLQLLKTVQEK